MPLLEPLFALRDADHEPQPFLHHLEELRRVLFKMAATLMLFMMGSFWFRRELIDLIQRPLRVANPEMVSRLQVLGVLDSITISLSLAFYAGITLSLPLLLFFLAQFVFPALTRGEKKVVLPAIGVGFGLFLSGVAFCYFCILPQTLLFLLHDAKSLEWSPLWTVREYFSFVTQILMAFGLAFELPVAVFTLARLRIVTFALLNRTRRYAYFLIFVLAAIIAPTPDPISFLSLGIPMVLLYEGCIWMVWMLEKRRAEREKRLGRPTL